jgi:hypothetical protein
MRKWRAGVFGGAISLFLLFLVADLLIKFLAYGAEFDSKISPFIRLFYTFVIYFLIVRYLRVENFQAFLVSCYLLCIASVLIFLGYILLLVPIPTGFVPALLPSSEAGSQPIRFGIPNALFVLFPYFMATARVFSKVGNGRAIEKLTMLFVAIGSALALFRMYLFIVLFGGVLAFVRGRGRATQKLAIGSIVAFGLYFAVQFISTAKETGIVEAFVGRFSATAEEFNDEESSAGGRVVRTYAAIGQLMQPNVLLLGTVFTKEFSEVTAFATADLGVVVTLLEYGLPGLVLMVFVYRKGVPAALVLEKRAGPLGQCARALLLFMTAMLPATLFMYNPLESEMMIALWATFVGSFDATYLMDNPPGMDAVHTGASS